MGGCFAARPREILSSPLSPAALLTRREVKGDILLTVITQIYLVMATTGLLCDLRFQFMYVVVHVVKKNKTKQQTKKKPRRAEGRPARSLRLHRHTRVKLHRSVQSQLPMVLHVAPAVVFALCYSFLFRSSAVYSFTLEI